MSARLRHARRAATALVVAALVGTLVGCASVADDVTVAERAAPAERVVVVISIDAFNPAALARLGPSRTPHIHALIEEGTSTLNARTEHELTNTLPNHTGMVTGRRVDASKGGHGVTWNDDRRRPRTVHAAAGHRVESVFTVVDDAGLSAGYFASKTKFSLWDRTWRSATDTQRIIEDNDALVTAFRRDLVRESRAFRFLHLSESDSVGHEEGFMSPAYLRAIRRADARVGIIVDTIRRDPELAARTTLILTADHGGAGADHGVPTELANYRVPFVVWGAEVAPGTDLYDLNPDYLDPGRARKGYFDTQPVRNGDVANLALDLLDLPSVPGSEHDVAQDLDVG